MTQDKQDSGKTTKQIVDEIMDARARVKNIESALNDARKAYSEAFYQLRPKEESDTRERRYLTSDSRFIVRIYRRQYGGLSGIGPWECSVQRLETDDA